MLALSPLISTLGWTLDDPTIYEQNQSSVSVVGCLAAAVAASSEPYVNVGDEDQSPCGRSSTLKDATKVKKMNHNASERNRRTKINSLYSSLGALLPASDQTKKLSIPATVSRVVKYIPELQKEVESLAERKEKLLLNNSGSLALQSAGNVNHPQLKQRERESEVEGSLLCAVSLSRLGDKEFGIQISTLETERYRTSFSDMLQLLEQNGLLVMGMSSFQSCAGRVFYNIHLQVEETCMMSCESLREMLLSLYNKIS
ncbi:hypothetical protein Ancab_013897 [Ancistrocladus abbreviatus]